MQGKKEHGTEEGNSVLPNTNGSPDDGEEVVSTSVSTTQRLVENIFPVSLFTYCRLFTYFPSCKVWLGNITLGNRYL